jgi:hypothetical protein
MKKILMAGGAGFFWDNPGKCIMLGLMQKVIDFASSSSIIVYKHLPIQGYNILLTTFPLKRELWKSNPNN